MRYFWADPHLDREGSNVLLRPFSNKLEMSLHLIEEVNLRVRKQDQLIIVGDFADDKKPGFWRQRICCRDVWLVHGNHDPSIPQCKRVFGEHKVTLRLLTKACGHITICNHHPELYWHKSHHGSFCLHGHVHDQRSATIETAFPGIRLLDVGVDTAKRLLGKYTCFSEQEVFGILINRPGHDHVAWYEEQRGKYAKDHAGL